MLYTRPSGRKKLHSHSEGATGQTEHPRMKPPAQNNTSVIAFAGLLILVGSCERWRMLSFAVNVKHGRTKLSDHIRYTKMDLTHNSTVDLEAFLVIKPTIRGNFSAYVTGKYYLFVTQIKTTMRYHLTLVRIATIAIPFSWGSSPPRDWTGFSCIAGRFFTIWATREASSRSLEIINVGERVEKKECFYTFGSNANWYSHYGEQ